MDKQTPINSSPEPEQTTHAEKKPQEDQELTQVRVVNLREYIQSLPPGCKISIHPPKPGRTSSILDELTLVKLDEEQAPPDKQTPINLSPEPEQTTLAEKKPQEDQELTQVKVVNLREYIQSLPPGCKIDIYRPKPGEESSVLDNLTPVKLDEEQTPPDKKP